jgi:hypothetical protein
VSGILELLSLGRHLLPEMAGGFIAYCLHLAYHKLYAAIVKHLPRHPS